MQTYDPQRGKVRKDEGAKIQWVIKPLRLSAFLCELCAKKMPLAVAIGYWH